MTQWLHFHFSLSCIGEGNGNPLQCSCLENPMDGRAWWAALYGVAQSRTRLKRLSSSSRISVAPTLENKIKLFSSRKQFNAYTHQMYMTDFTALYFHQHFVLIIFFNFSHSGSLPESLHCGFICMSWWLTWSRNFWYILLITCISWFMNFISTSLSYFSSRLSFSY